MLSSRRMMLISNSFCFKQTYLAHCLEAIKDFLGPVKTIAFVPYAVKDWDSYTRSVNDAFEPIGIKVLGFHSPYEPHEAMSMADAIFIGGGNTFRLLKGLYDFSLLGAIRDWTNDRPFLGSSAGSNVACPTMMTTNDWPIVRPPSFEALNLFPFQINPHYVDHDPTSTHMGESREKRIAEFHEENDTPVIGLREGSWIVAEVGVAYLRGTTGAKLFVKNEPPREWIGGELKL